MEAAHLRLEVLKEIRQEARETNRRPDAPGEDTGRRFGETHERLDALSWRIVESEVRASTATADLAGRVRLERERAFERTRARCAAPVVSDAPLAW
jgi:hypothetical protein